MPESYSSGRSTRSTAARSSASRSSGTRSSNVSRSSSGRAYSDTPRRSSGSRPTGNHPSGYRTSGSRPSGNRPSGNSPRRSGTSSRNRRRRKSIQPRFFLILAVIVVIIIALIVFFTGKGGNTPVTPQATPTAAPNSGVESNVVITAGNTETENNDSNSGSFENLNGPVETDDDDDGLVKISEEDRIQVSPAELSVNTSLPDTWLNILLLGSDERFQNENARTDTMIICSINKDTGAVKLTSIMRDSAIKITGNPKYNGTYRINSANYFGGPNYAMKVVNENLGMNIQYYANVNFFGFQRIARALGGIDVDISEAEMNEINRKQIEQAKIAFNNGWDEGEMENELLTTFGKNTHLNARQTVAYARVRKIDSDFSRSERQRIVLVKLMEKLKGKSMAELAVLGTSLIDNVTTNMDFNTILDIATKVLSSGLSLNSDNMLRLPLNGTYTEEVRNEDAMFYDIDWDTNAKELYNFIYVKK